MTPLRAALIAVVGVTAGLGATQNPPAVGRQTGELRQEERSGLQVVDIYACVRDQAGRIINDLTREDFTVLDQGTPATVSVFAATTPPAASVLLIDMGDNAVGKYHEVQDGARRLVQNVAPDDRLRIETFGQEIALSPLLTNDKTTLLRVIDEELWPGGPAPVWLASRLAMNSLVLEKGRRVIIVWSLGHETGHDNANCPQSNTTRDAKPLACVTANDVRELARSGRFGIYAIGPDPSKMDNDLVRIVDESGGGVFDTGHDADVAAAVDGLADELRHQYVLGFIPAVRDGRIHQLEITVNRPGATVRARRTFVAEDK